MSLFPPTEATAAAESLSTFALDLRLDSVETDVGQRARNVKLAVGVLTGAAGNGVANDAPIIQAHIDAANAAGGGIVYFPPGTYKVSTSLQIKSNVVLAGAGREKTVVDAGSVAADPTDLYYYGIRGKGTIATATLLSTDARKGEMQAAVVSTSGLAAGDFVVLGSNGPRGTLNTTINSSATTIVVDVLSNVGSFSARGYLAIEDEQIGYSSVSVVGSQATFTVRSGALGRGAQGTTAATHTAGVRVSEFNSGKFLLWRPNCFDRGEIKRISSISGTTIYFEQPLNDDYTVGNAGFVRKVSMVSDFEIRDLTIKHPTSIVAHTEWGIGLEWCDNFTIENCGVHYASHINIGLNNCTRFRIAGNFIYGKGISDPGGTHALYSIATYNACQWGTVAGNHAARAFKIFTCSANTAGQNWWGIPRDISVVNNTLDNSAVGFYSRHPGIELHGAGERIAVVGNTVHGADSIVSVQTVRDVVVQGNVGSGWYRAGIIFSGAHELARVKIADNNLGSRTVGTGLTTLSAGIDAVVTTVPAASTTSFLDDTTATGAGQVIKIDSELIRYSAVNGTNFLTCIRGFMGTTAAAHSNGATVTPFGSGSPCPIDLDLTDCVWGQRAYNQPVTALTVDPGTGGTTLTVGDTTGFAATGLAVIEGEDSAKNFQPEVVAYTGLTATTLTGCTRSQEFTPAAAHSVGCFVMPYEMPVTQIEIKGNQAELDANYYGLYVRGYTPTRQFRVEGNQLMYTGSARATNEAFRVESHGVKIRNNEIYGWALGYRAAGNGQLWRGNECEVTVQETVSTGYGLRVDGTDCKVFENILSRVYQAVQIGAASLRTTVARNVFDVPLSSRGITGTWDTTTIARDNTFVLPSGQDLAATSAATTVLNCPGNYKWRVTGTATVTVIAVQADGTEITLKFDGAATISNVATIKLAGAANFVATADDVLTLISDGTAWREKARSVN